MSENQRISTKKSKKIVECVPNFSEGRNLNKIKEITDVIAATPGVTLLDVEPGAATNRTVVTFIGDPLAVAEAAFRAIAKAAEIIDMSKHKGAHPRFGATDVCPFVPVEGVTMGECAEIAHKVGQRVGRELNIPVYFYEAAAKTIERKNLAAVRSGEYEGLEEKLKDSKWKPDEGPQKFNVRAGAIAMGAREFLIAYNITLASTQKQLATDIAFELREKGRVARRGNTKPIYLKGEILFYKKESFPCGNCDYIGATFDETRKHCNGEHGYDLDQLLKLNNIDSKKDIVGHKVYRAGKFKDCKAIGWFVDEYKRAQISINLTNYKVTSMHDVLDAARTLADNRGVVVTGSEVCGIVPYHALFEAGKYYLNKQGKHAGVPAADVLNAGVYGLKLDDATSFEIEKKVIGVPDCFYGGHLVRLPLKDLADEVSRDTPAPGGGSIAAVSGALGGALVSMVAALTHGKEGTEERDQKLAEIAEKVQIIKDKLIEGVDADTNAFNAYMEARRLPNASADEKKYREEQMLGGMKAAINVPMDTARSSCEIIGLAFDVAKIGNPNSLSDAAVGAQTAYAGVRGGVWNVLINLKDVSDSKYIKEMQKKCDELLFKAQKQLDEVTSFIDKKLLEMISESKKG